MIRYSCPHCNSTQQKHGLSSQNGTDCSACRRSFTWWQAVGLQARLYCLCPSCEQVVRLTNADLDACCARCAVCRRFFVLLEVKVMMGKRPVEILPVQRQAAERVGTATVVLATLTLDTDFLREQVEDTQEINRLRRAQDEMVNQERFAPIAAALSEELQHSIQWLNIDKIDEAILGFTGVLDLYRRARELNWEAEGMLDRGFYVDTLLKHGDVLMEKGSRVEQGSPNARRCYRQACADYAEARQLAPEAVDVLLRLAGARMRLGEDDLAISDCSEAIGLNPQNRDAFYWRGLARLEHGDPTGAVHDLETARRIDPQAAGVAEALAAAKLRLPAP